MIISHYTLFLGATWAGLFRKKASLTTSSRRNSWPQIFRVKNNHCQARGSYKKSFTLPARILLRRGKHCLVHHSILPCKYRNERFCLVCHAGIYDIREKKSPHLHMTVAMANYRPCRCNPTIYRVSPRFRRRPMMTPPLAFALAGLQHNNDCP